jgi:uroporphyrinogen decarboxylase
MTEMTSRERLLAAYRHAPVDRVPCSPRVWAWLLATYGSDSIENNLALADRFGYDPHFVISVFEHPSDLLSFQETYSLPNADYRFEERRENDYRVVRRTFQTPKGPLTDETRFPPKGDRRYGIAPNPIRTEHLVKSPDDLERLSYLIADKRGADFARFRKTEERVGERGLVILAILSPLCHRAADVYPMEELMMAFYDDRAFFDALLDFYQREMMDEVRVSIEKGVRHFYANWYYNSLSTGWSPRIWKEVFAPQLKEMTSAVHKAGGTVNLYDDGKCMGIIELLAECGIGDRVCLMGYVDLLYVIQMGTPELIDRTVKQAIETAAPGGGFILGTSDSIRDGTPFENVQAYFDAARKYGRQRPG